MHRIRYRITTLSPVLFVMNVGDTNMVATRDYIPGSVVMGLFAGEFIRKNSLDSNAHTNPTFYQWFLQGDVRFTNAYILSQAEREQFQKYFPIPLSIQHEKNNENTFYDLLFPDDTVEQPVYEGGFGRMEGKRLYWQPVNKSLNFHHQRDPEKGTVREGMIFNYESMDANQAFEGNILGGCEALKEVLAMFPNAQTAYIGRSRNAQYGKIRFEFISNEPEEFVSEIDGFTANKLEIENGEVTLTLLSNTIICNDNGLSTMEVTELENLLRNSLGKSIVVKKAFIKADEVENFVSVWRLRRPSEVCFKAGSCFLLEGISPEYKEKLFGLQRNGIGERRGEGFGRIVFGWQNNPDTYTLGKIERKCIEWTKTVIPNKILEIVRTIVDDFIRKKVALEALREAKNFVHENQKETLKSLIGRLEAMVKKLSKTEFRNALENDLRKTAKDNLENCRGTTMTLFEFLKTKDISSKDMLNQTTEVKKLCDEPGFEYKKDQGFDDELYRIYFQTFFSEMRRILRKG